MQRSVVAMVWAGLVALLLVFGCATTRGIVGAGGGLKKKLAVMPVVNRTGYGGAAFSADAVGNLETFILRHCKDLIILDRQKTREVLAGTAGLADEPVDNVKLAEAGRILGVNAILEETLVDIVCSAEKKGVYGFREMAPIVTLVGRIRALDPQTGAILFDEVFEEEAAVGELTWQHIRARKGYHPEIANQFLTRMTERMCEFVAGRLCSMPWKGYITAISGDLFTLSAGKDVGLAEGDVLEVFGTSGVIKGPAGQIYVLSGSKIGELQVTEARLSDAEAIAIEGDGLQESTHLLLKR